MFVGITINEVIDDDFPNRTGCGTIFFRIGGVKMEYLAHIAEDGRKQTVKEHCEGTAKLTSDFADVFGVGELGKLAGLAHDIGKYSEAFQNRLLRDGKKVDHASAGAYECFLMRQAAAMFCVAGHHSGLPDMGERDDMDGGTLWGKLNRAKNGKVPDYSDWKNEIRLIPAAAPPFCGNNPQTDAFFTRMLYSCLVDADFLDTEQFMAEGGVSRGGGDSIENLNRLLDIYIAEWFPPKGELNAKRCEILKNCMLKGEKLKRGLYTLTVPTGGGKTVASLAFALRQAKRNGMKRIVYVIPYTSIIEQTAATFRQILGSDNVLEHHSGFDIDETDLDSKQKLTISKAVENWDMPVIVTTAVQFFESLYANKSSKCRKLHNIADSVIIFDEAQMLPLPFLRPCVLSIVQLTEYYKCTAVLCTATQPALTKVIREFIPDYLPIELCPAELSSDRIFRRTLIQSVGEMSWEAVADQMKISNQILCIVNSRKNARTVYSHLEGEGCFHLSTLMTPTDRERAVVEIRQRLRDGRACKVVSTSLIEAGVDVDFPQVMREEAGLDSILQAAGRCNREGKRLLENSVVTVFKAETPPPRLFGTQIGIGRRVMRMYSDLFEPDAIREYFTELIDLSGKEALDKAEILKLLGNGSFSFKTAAERFHLIENNTVTVYIPIGDGEALVNQYRYGEITKRLIRKLGKYGVNIYEDHFKALYASGDVELIADRCCVLTNMSLYDEKTGLSLTADIGKAEFI